MRKLVIAAVVGTALSLSACSKKDEGNEEYNAEDSSMADSSANTDATGENLPADTATEAANTAAEVASEAGQAAESAADAANKAADAAEKVAEEAAQ